MKRRTFVKNVSFSSITIPFMFNNLKWEAVQNKLFDYSRSAEDRVLILIRLNGGNDGLNTLIPLDQYDNLMIQRPNVLIPQGFIIPITDTNGLHPSMTGVASMFNDGKVSVIQNVGYPEQNRSHFRSLDIWSYGSTNQEISTGWMGRYLDSVYPGYPENYPNEENPDPFAISMGYEVSTTCQGVMSNFSHTVPNPHDDINVGNGTALNDGTYYGSHMEYLSTIIAQTNAYGTRVKQAADQGNSTSSLYDMNNPLSVHMSYIAKMISGGLKTKIYVVNINGFDTHAEQVDSSDTTVGNHAKLLKTLSDAVKSFQDDIKLQGLEHRVVGMTFSEFGRQIASNASFGTDHGDAAPLFLFGTCISSQIIGPNPVISDQIQNQAGLNMQIDFRDVYASVIKDWFGVDENAVQSLFDYPVNFYTVLQGCSAGINEEIKKKSLAAIVYPNPCVNTAHLKFSCLNEKVQIILNDSYGKTIKELFSKELKAGVHHVELETKSLSEGTYFVIINKKSKNEEIKIIKRNH
ncbi:MAG: DUF1501 domain-containing protein [Flavobacteriia bacterium]|nr:DUF1501 domain-containing protein [Flavobacteriia bacterium]